MHLANAYLFLVVARIIATFELLPETVDGAPKMPPLEFETGLVPYVAQVAYIPLLGLTALSGQYAKGIRMQVEA